MPEYCCVPGCSSATGGHGFPRQSKSPERRKAWIITVRRVDQTNHDKLWEPSAASKVCKKHFLEEDYKPSLLGERQRLKANVVPSVFPHRAPMTECARARKRRLDVRLQSKAECTPAKTVCTEPPELRLDDVPLSVAAEVTIDCTMGDSGSTQPPGFEDDESQEPPSLDHTEAGVQCTLLRPGINFQLSTFKDELASDRKVASKRIHVERVIGLAKTFKILKRELPAQRIVLGNHIINVCIFLSNLKKCIVGYDA